MARIVYVAPFGLAQKTTVWARTLPLARVVAMCGHTVSLLIPPWDSRADAGRRWDDAGVEVVNLDLGGGLPSLMARLMAALDARQPDLVHIVKPRAYAGLAQWWLWRRRRRPALLLDIDDWEQAWASINRYPAPTARFLAWQEEWGIRHADAITAASHWLEERARAYSPATPVLYLPNGVAPPSEPSRLAGSRSKQPTVLTVLYFTRYVEAPPEWLAAFWRSLAAMTPGVRLVVAGRPLQAGRDTLYRAVMEQQAGSAAAAVEWLGAVQPEAVAALQQQATCAIFPAEATPLHQAKCSVRLATTLLQGVPVVASAVGEQAHYGAAGAAVLTPAGAPPEEFAAAVAGVLAAPEQQAELARQARSRLLDMYNWSRLGHQLEEFYGGILSRERQR